MLSLSVRVSVLICLAPVWVLLAAGATPSTDAIARLPAVASRPVDFVGDIQPILEASCVKCHGRGKAKGDWRLDTRDTFLEPGASGPAIVNGNSSLSRLIHLVAGTDPDELMPQKGKKLTSEQVGLLRAWVDQGLKWAPEVTFAMPATRNLHPRLPDLPGLSGIHPIDALTGAYDKRHGVSVLDVVDDRLYMRRVCLDVIGLLPDPVELEAFAADTSRDKRAHLVNRLLADDHRYAQHWLTFWNDLLRNDYRGTGYIDGGRKQISAWLYSALRDNKPYDQFVRELVNPTDASEGFSRGIVWRGTVNASMTPPMQAAQNIGQVLMGVNLKCASCHDSFIDDWQLSDSYGLAGIYADEKLEMVLCDKPTGQFAPLKFLFPELGSVDSSAPRSLRLEQLARIITGYDNGRLPRTMVNRLWARLLGRGLVEPLDVMQNEAWDPDLLDWLAEDLVEHRWDLKRTMGLILTSRAYQLPAVSLPEGEDPSFVFHGPGVRRLTAEQFRDALGSITGVWQDKPEGGLDSLLVEPGEARALSAEAFWIWSDPDAASGVFPSTNWFRKELLTSGEPSEATLFVHADNSVRVFLNGRRIKGADAPDWSRPGIYDLRKSLQSGTNLLVLEVINGGDSSNPAGVLAYLKMRAEKDGAGAVLDMASDASWQAATQTLDPAKDSPSAVDWKSASALGPLGMEPWNLGGVLARSVSGPKVYGSVRASLTAADPLSLALGRPNREQVVTVRQSIPTTIQALELTNGETLAGLLQQGAKRLVTDGVDGPTLVARIFTLALSRPPTPRELKLALDLVGMQPRREGVEDLLWAVTMLPEFQLTF